MGEVKPKVVLDTNILVAAGFNPDSHSARITKLIKDDQVKFVWNKSTKAESRRILGKIPPLDWPEFEWMFTPVSEQQENVDIKPDWLAEIDDPADRKFAALAAAAEAILVSNDDHLLSVRQQLPVTIHTPTELIEHLEQTN